MTTRSLLLFRLAVSLVLSIALFFQGFMLLRIWQQVQALDGQAFTIPATAIGYLVLTTAIVLAGSALVAALLIRSACSAEGRALATFLTCFVYVTGSIDTIYTLRQEGGLPWYLDAVLNFSIPLSVAVALAAMLRFSALFPIRLEPEQIERQRLLPGIRVALLDPRLLWLSAIGLAVTAQTSLLVAMELRRHVQALNAFHFPIHQMLMVVLVIATLLITVANLRTAYRAADADGRRRVYWVLEGLLAGTVIVVFASMLKAAVLITGAAAWFEPWYPLSFFVALLVVIGFFAIAMFYVGALDPLLAIRRTAVTGMVGITMVFIFAVTQQMVHEYLVAWTGISDRVGGMVTGGIVALSFEPVQRRLSGLVSRWVEGREGAVAAEDARGDSDVQPAAAVV